MRRLFLIGLFLTHCLAGHGRGASENVQWRTLDKEPHAGKGMKLSLVQVARRILMGERSAEEVLEGRSPSNEGQVVEGRVHKLGRDIREADLKVLKLPHHEQHSRINSYSFPEESLPKNDHAVPPQRMQCAAKICPVVAPCQAGTGVSQSDHLASSCWNPDLAEPAVRFRPVLQLDPSMMEYNALDICPAGITGKVGDVIKPGCAWRGERGKGKGEWWREGWAGQVYVLENVYLDSNGRVFNRTHLFDTGGCLNPTELVHPRSTGFSEVPEVVNIMAASPHSLPNKAQRKSPVLYATAFELPLLLPVLRVLPLLDKSILASRNKKFHRLVSSHLIKEPELHSKLHTIAAPASGTLWLVKRLIQPVFQACHQPCPALWRKLRIQHLLPQPIAEAAEGPPPEIPLMPPANPLIPWNWVVVVHDKVLTSVNNPEKFMGLLRQFFRAERILMFASGKPIAEDMELLGRAALFITLSHSAFSNVIFMPPNATVVELRVSGQNPKQAADSALAIALAEACDLRPYVLFCGTERGDGQVYCSFEALLGILDRASLDAYTAHPAPRVARPEVADSATDPSTSWFGKSQADVDQFKEWANCVSTKGGWEYNPKPRILAWEYTGYMNLCDHRHGGKGGLVTKKADDAVVAGASPEDWNVRKSLKYEWVVPPAGNCPVSSFVPGKVSSFAEFSGFQFCQKVGKGRTIMFIGDSLQDQFVSVFLNNMLKHIPKPATSAITDTIPQECIDWLPPDGMVRHIFCRDIHFNNDVCPGMRVIFVRSDFITLHNPRKFDRIQFSRLSFLAAVDVAILNRGAHYKPTPIFSRDLTATLRYFRNRFPKLLVVYRNTPPGHKDCQHAWPEPLIVRQRAETLPYYWGEFELQNQVAKQIVEENDYVYMDVDTMTSLRADGHKGWREDNITDCLHYCTPGPLDLWPQHLYNTLLWVLPLSHLT